MAYKDGEVFTTYCDKPYDKHRYRIEFKNGKSIVFDDYDQMRFYWYQWKTNCDVVTILDPTRGKGF